MEVSLDRFKYKDKTNLNNELNWYSNGRTRLDAKWSGIQMPFEYLKMAITITFLALFHQYSIFFLQLVTSEESFMWLEHTQL